MTLRGHLRLALTLLAALLLAIAAQLLLPGRALAQAGAIGTSVDGYGFGDWLGLGARLVAVLITIWLAVLGMRWYVRRTTGAAGGAGRQLQVIESRSLGPNRSLHLVRLGGRAVMLGVTPERINALLTIDDAEEVERLAAGAGSAERSLRQITGSMRSLARISLSALKGRSASVDRGPGRATAWLAGLLKPAPRVRRQRPRPGRLVPAAAALPGTASQRARTAAAYGREASLAAAQRAISDARGDAR
jgi:flagellar biosynthetic protein FliO